MAPAVKGHVAEEDCLLATRVSDIEIITARTILHQRRLRNHKLLAFLAVLDCLLVFLLWALVCELQTAHPNNSVVHSIVEYSFSTSLFDFAVRTFLASLLYETLVELSAAFEYQPAPAPTCRPLFMRLGRLFPTVPGGWPGHHYSGRVLVRPPPEPLATILDDDGISGTGGRQGFLFPV